MAEPRRVRNRLLASLPDAAFERLQPHLDLIMVSAGDELYKAWTPVRHAYFPDDAIISLGHTLRDDRTVAIAMVGNEGMLGVGLVLGAEASPYRALVQNGGRVRRIAIERLREEFATGGRVVYAVLRYTQALIAQIAQTAVCNRHHSIEQQVCRWMLMTADRMADDSIEATQELIAGALGVRREGVTEAALRLQKAGTIEYYRGSITLRDRPALEARACECYRVVRQEFERLLVPPTAAGAGLSRSRTPRSSRSHSR